MIDVYPGIYVGSDKDYNEWASHGSGFAIVHAAKEPWHRKAVGYRGRGCPKDSPEYLVARRDHRLMLNMIDTEDPTYVPMAMIWQSLKFIEEHHEAGYKVLIACNKGESRAPSIAMLYLSAWLKVIPNKTIEEAEDHFVELYPNYHPRSGIRLHLKENWERYRNE
jgi:hypothetical protein